MVGNGGEIQRGGDSGKAEEEQEEWAVAGEEAAVVGGAGRGVGGEVVVCVVAVGKTANAAGMGSMDTAGADKDSGGAADAEDSDDGRGEEMEG